VMRGLLRRASRHGAMSRMPFGAVHADLQRPAYRPAASSRLPFQGQHPPLPDGRDVSAACTAIDCNNYDDMRISPL
jgi:hypothetical protein